MTRYLVTSALPYSNGRLHVGHIAGAYLPADSYVRYLRARGRTVRFICGSDDNGVASLISARKENRPVEELTRDYHDRQAADFAGLRIRFDVYGGTHHPDFVETHNRLSQAFFRAIHDKGFFTKKKTQQLYDAVAGQFLPDRYVKGTCNFCGYREAYGDQCEACGKSIDPLALINPVSTITGTPPEPRETTHWYLRLDRFEQPLREWLEGKRDSWRELVLNFSLGQIKQGLVERAMTRDLSWGVPVPLDDPDAAGKVLYVWFDAPIGYVSFAAKLCEELGEGPEAYARWWKDPDCRIVHFIGEDNIVFHAIIWPAMLLAEGTYQLPHQVVANAFLNIKFPGKEEEKVSKSRGAAIWIEDYLKKYDPDPLRYYLTTIAPENQRTTFDVEDFIARNNGELGNTLGNFINRALTFTVKHFEGRVPPAGARDQRDEAQVAARATQAEKVAAQLEAFRFKNALYEVMELARMANRYMDEKAPWTQRKTDLAACGTTLNVCIQTIRTLMVVMEPFLPATAEKCAAMLGLRSIPMWDEATDELPAGHVLGEPQILFKRLETAEL